MIKRSRSLLSTSSSTELLSRGVGLYGALGNGELLDSDEFRVVNIQNFTPKKVSAGWGHSAVLTNCGKVLIFGRPFDFSTLLRLNAFREVGTASIARYASAMAQWFSSDIQSSGLFPSPMCLSDCIPAAAGITEVFL